MVRGYYGRSREHAMNRKGISTKIPNGLARRKGIVEKDVDPDELSIGIEIEMEHTTDRELAKQIALDHLTEYENYYSELVKLEKRLERQTVKFDKSFDDKEIAKIRHRLPEAERLILAITKRDVSLPKKIKGMSDKEIQKYKGTGGGHGLFIPPDTIKINPHMDSNGILLNYIHENIHFVLPNARENVVDYLTESIAFQMKLER